MKDCVLFLPGRYRADHLTFYKRFCRGKFKIAVDGGHRFFVASGITPNLLLGDLDSLGKKPVGLSKRTAVHTFPIDKDKTDAQLALEYCLSKRAGKIDIVQPNVGQPDHFAANLMLLTMVSEKTRRGYRPEVRLVSRHHEIMFLRNRQVNFQRDPGDILSVIPLSDRILLSCAGTAYDVNRLKVVRGATISLRNRIIARRARVEVTGEALLFVLYRRK